MIAALPVIAQPGAGWRHDGRHGPRRVPTVTLYEHADFRGASLTLTLGERVPNLDWARFDNGARIIALAIFLGYVSIPIAVLLGYGKPYVNRSTGSEPAHLRAGTEGK